MSTTTNLGRITTIYKGAYSAATTYSKLDVVYYGGSSYVALQTVTGVTPADDGTYWRMAAKGGELANVIADTYDATATYAVGDYCIYDGGLYRCAVAITTAEAWTAWHWASVQTTGETLQTKKDLGALTAGTIEYAKDPIRAAESTTTGGLSASTTRLSITSKLKADSLITVKVNGQKVYPHAWTLNADGTYTYVALTLGFQTTDFTINIDSYYYDFVVAKTDNSTILPSEMAVSITKEWANAEKPEILEDTVEEIQAGIDDNVYETVASKNLIPSTEYDAKCIDPSGELVDSDTYVTTAYIPVEGKRTVAFTRITGGSYGAYTRGKDYMKAIAFYDSDKALISFISKSGVKLSVTDVTTPAFCKYVKFSFDDAYTATHKPMLEYTDNSTAIATDYVAYFTPYVEYNDNVNANLAKEYTDTVAFTTPLPLKPTYVKKSGQYNGCLSDIKTVGNYDVLYGFSGAQLVRSANGTDKGNPAINIQKPATGTVNFLKKLDDGTLLAGYEDVNGYARIYKGTAEVWDSSTSTFTTTWTETLTAETAGQRWSMWFGLSIYKNVVFVGEYGAHNSARNAYLSTDYGATFTKVFTVAVDSSGAGSHVHDVCYDPYSEMLWVVTGDGYWAQNVYFSYDMGTTWNTNYGYHESPSQFTSIMPLPNCVLFTSDNSEHMAVYRCNRASLRSKPTHVELEQAYVFYDDYDAESPIGTNGCIVYGKDPCVYFGWTERLDVVKTKAPVIGTKDGYNFYEVWNCGETIAQVSGSTSYVGIYGVYGVTDTGYIAVSFTKSETGTTGKHSIVFPMQEWC